jgi:hypothetical protein
MTIRLTSPLAPSRRREVTARLPHSVRRLTWRGEFYSLANAGLIGFGEPRLGVIFLREDAG